MENTHGEVLLLVKLQAVKVSFPNGYFSQLYKWYQIALNITNANLIFLNTLIHNPSLMLKWIQTTIIPRKIIKNRILNFGSNINTLSVKLTKWPNTFKQFVGNWPTNCLSVFGHFVGLALKGLRF